MSDVLQAFANVRPSGQGWTARCPAHNDNRSSLSIGIGDGGKILLWCHAGCELDDILAAGRLEHADLYAERPPNQDARSRTIAATYAYHDEAGTHLYDVLRFVPKDFRQRRADGTWSLAGVRRVLYRLPELKGHPTVLVVEGEKDVERLHALGLTATTNAGGAGKWQDAYAEQLRAAGCAHVAVIGDNDAVGHAHALMVARSCHAAGLKAKTITLPGMPEHGDVSDYLAAHTKDDLLALIRSAAVFSPDQAKGQTIGGPTLTRLSDVAAEKVDWLWPSRFARGKYTLIAGDPGKGKSRLTFHCAALVTRGGAWPDGGRAPQGNVLFLLAEDGLADTVRPAIESMGGDLTRVFILEGVSEGRTTRHLNLAKDLSVVDAALAEVRPELLVIDPITAFLGKTDSYKDAEVRGLLAPLIASAARHRTALVAVAHLAKDQQRAALHRPGGSIAFVAAARLVFALGPDPNDDDRRILAPLKSNICAPAPSLAFRLPDGCVEWETGAVTMDAETLLGPTTTGSRTSPHDRADAEAFLRSILKNGPMESERISKQAGQQGISRATLRRAREGMGIKPTLAGFGSAGRRDRSLPSVSEREHLLENPNVSPEMSRDAQVITSAPSLTRDAHSEMLTSSPEHLCQTLNKTTDFARDAHDGSTTETEADLARF